MNYNNLVSPYIELNVKSIQTLGIFHQDTDFLRAFEDAYLNHEQANFYFHVYKNGSNNLKGLEAFGYFKKKIQRLEKTIQHLMDLNLGKRLETLRIGLNQKTTQLIEAEEIFAQDIQSYSVYVELQLQQLKKSNWISLIEKLENQINNLKEDLPKIEPIEFLQSYEWKRANKNFFEKSTKIQLIIPETITNGSATIYHNQTEYNLSSGIENTKSSIDVWKKENNHWVKYPY